MVRPSARVLDVIGLLARLLAGLGTRMVAIVSAVVLVAFVGAVAQSWARGPTIDCGCFGGGGQVAPGETQYPQEIARDLGFLLLAGWLLARPRSRASLDGWLATKAPEVETVDTQGRT